MSKHTPGPKSGRAAPLGAKVDRIIRSLAGSAFDPADPVEEPSLSFAPPEEIVAHVLDLWQARARHVPTELLSDPAWGMLLELLLAEIQGRRVSLRRLCNLSAVPETTALRWVKALERLGLTVRQTDPRDSKEVFVELSKKGRLALQHYFHDAVQAQ